MRHGWPILLALLFVVPSPVAAHGDAPPADHPFAVASVSCGDALPAWLLDVEGDCSVNATGIVRFLGCENAQCGFEVTGFAAAEGLQAGAPRLHLFVDTVVLGPSGGGTKRFTMCSAAEVLRPLQCSGSAGWTTLAWPNDCMHLHVHARYRNAPTGIALLGADPGLVEGASALAAFQLCRDRDGAITFGPWAPPPPRPPGTVEIVRAVPEGHFAALRVNMSADTDLDLETWLKLARFEGSASAPVDAKMFGAIDGRPLAWLSYGSQSAGLQTEPLLSANLLGDHHHVTLDPPGYTAGGLSTIGSISYFGNWAESPRTYMIAFLALGAPGTFTARLDFTQGVSSWDVVVAEGFGLTKNGFDSGAHATLSNPLGSGISVGAAMQHEREVQQDAIAVWTGGNRFDTLGTTMASCEEEGEPCADTWRGISTLVAHGPERWRFAIDVDARHENDRYVLYGIELPDRSYFQASG